MTEVNLLRNYPKTERDLKERVLGKSDKVKSVARKFGFDYFDGDRKYGYGGFSYNEKYWSQVVDDFFEFYKLSPASSVLDVGCGKGFMLYDFKRKHPNLRVQGIDISDYAIDNAKIEVRDFLIQGDARQLPFENQSFDLVISINTIHNLEESDCATALKEIQRVARRDAFVVVDAYETEEQKQRMLDWNLTALTIKSTSEWKEFFKESGYSHDFYWFMP
jgi:ubiquinone/menaquinone biosynthesis C-methylase UbiE